MPTRKTFVTLIISVGILVSVWLILQIPAKSLEKPASSVVVANPYDYATAPINDDWKKMLVSVNTKDEPLAKNSSGDVVEESTLTGQLAKDILARTMIATKNGGQLTQSDIDTMISAALASPEYSKTTGTVYLQSNLHVIGSNDRTILGQYKDNFTRKMQQRMTQAKSIDDPLKILIDSLEFSNNGEENIAKLDPIIQANKDFIQDLLTMEVPTSAINTHLGILNASSNVLSNIEGMRRVYDDPVKAFIGANQYGDHLTEFTTALTKINQFFTQNKL